jgi:hypothetical protein
MLLNFGKTNSIVKYASNSGSTYHDFVAFDEKGKIDEGSVGHVSKL